MQMYELTSPDIILFWRIPNFDETCVPIDTTSK